MYILFVLLWVGLCAIPGNLAKEKGMGFGTGFFIGLVLGPVIGTLLVCLLPGSAPAKTSRRRLARPGSSARPGAKSRRPMMRK